MKPKLMLFVLLVLSSVSLVFTTKVKATYPDEGTTVPSPWPTVVFVTGKGVDTTQLYAPKVNDICWTWNHIIGRIGDYYVPSGKQLLVIKFTSNQSQILVNNVACENDANRTPMERAAWANAREPWYYTWDKIVTYYVGENMQIVTINPTPTSTAISGPTATPIPAPSPNMIFTTGESIDTTQNYNPKVNDICWTWNHIIGRIGNYYVPSGKQAVVIKFLNNQDTILVNNVVCENSPNIKPEERASWLNYREPSYYTWEKLVSHYVGANMQVVTLTSTPTITETPSITQTSSVTSTPSATVTITPTVTSTETETGTPTETVTLTVTKSPTWVASQTNTRSPTLTRTPTSTPTNSSTRTRTSTTTPTPKLGTFWQTNGDYVTLFFPKKGDVCYGSVLGQFSNVTIEYAINYSIGVAIKNGGCFKQDNYTKTEILKYLRSQGINYPDKTFPEPTATPTPTIVKYIPISYTSIGKTVFLPTEDTICWGERIGSYKYKVVKFDKTLKSPIELINGYCHLGLNISAEDVFNYVKRKTSIPLNGFLDVN
jgi:hypothetical protein